jgi:hypothetical protein
VTPDQSAAPGLWTIEASDRRASLAFKALVLPPATGRGILFSPERLNQLRSEPRYAVLREAIHREAQHQSQSLRFNQEAGESIALLPSESVHSGLTAYISLMNSYAAAIVYGALDYRLNGDRNSLQNVREALATVAKWKTWTPHWFTAHGMHTYYIVGVFTEQTSVGYDLVSNQLSLGERRAVEDALLAKSIQPAIDDYFLRQRMPTAASNHMAHSVGGSHGRLGRLQPYESTVACRTHDCVGGIASGVPGPAARLISWRREREGAGGISGFRHGRDDLWRRRAEESGDCAGGNRSNDGFILVVAIRGGESKLASRHRG